MLPMSLNALSSPGCESLSSPCMAVCEVERRCVFGHLEKPNVGRKPEADVTLERLQRTASMFAQKKSYVAAQPCHDNRIFQSEAA
jgi:hypothetical protein